MTSKKGYFPFVILLVDSRAVVDQKMHDTNVTSLCGAVKPCLALMVDGVDAGASG